MRCNQCKRDINRGTEAKKQVVYYQLPDGSEFRQCDFDNTGPAPKGGRLVRAYHYKCDRMREKRTRRGGDPIKGRGMGNDLPTAYDVVELALNKDDLKRMGITPEEAAGMSTASLQERAAKMRQEQIKKAQALDVGYREPEERDWRDQTVVEVGDVEDPGDPPG